SLLLILRIMDLQNVILEEHSKKQCTKIVEWVGNNQEKFDELFDLFLNGEYRITQRAAWPLSYCVIKYLESPNEAVAIKAFSITVLGKLAKKYPEIIPEIKLMIEEQLPHQSAAF